MVIPAHPMFQPKAHGLKTVSKASNQTISIELKNDFQIPTKHRNTMQAENKTLVSTLKREIQVRRKLSLVH